MNENRIIGILCQLDLDAPAETWNVSVDKQFATEYGGGVQTFTERAYGMHRALDVARGMVTLSPGRRTDGQTKEQIHVAADEFVRRVANCSVSIDLEEKPEKCRVLVHAFDRVYLGLDEAVEMRNALDAAIKLLQAVRS